MKVREAGREAKRKRRLQVDILNTNRPQVDFQMYVSKLFGYNSLQLWKGCFPFWEWIGKKHFNRSDQQIQTHLYLKRNRFEHSTTTCRSCLAWRGLPGNAIIHTSVSNEIVVTEAEQNHFLCLFALTNSQTGLEAQSYLWKALWSTELIKMTWFSVYIEITFW